jgi:hypothetical protein
MPSNHIMHRPQLRAPSLRTNRVRTHRTRSTSLFVAAGVERRFEDFTEDFAIWRVFYGARGGEVPSEAAASVRPAGENALRERFSLPQK